MSKVREEFLFLNRLRESGTINMFLAGLPLQEVFGLNRKEASKTLTEWMQWVSGNPEHRDL